MMHVICPGNGYPVMVNSTIQQTGGVSIAGFLGKQSRVCTVIARYHQKPGRCSLKKISKLPVEHHLRQSSVPRVPALPPLRLNRACDSSEVPKIPIQVILQHDRKSGLEKRQGKAPKASGYSGRIHLFAFPPGYTGFAIFHTVNPVFFRFCRGIVPKKIPSSPLTGEPFPKHMPEHQVPAKKKSAGSIRSPAMELFSPEMISQHHHEYEHAPPLGVARPPGQSLAGQECCL